MGGAKTKKTENSIRGAAPARGFGASAGDVYWVVGRPEPELSPVYTAEIASQVATSAERVPGSGLTPVGGDET